MDVDFEATAGHGDKPFSTYQARVLRSIATAEKPTAYVDLHSGFHSLMVSWGSRMSTTPDYRAQNQILSKIKKKHCPECEIGSNCVVIGYHNPGEIIDHMYEKQRVKYSTLWEIYDGAEKDDCLAFFNPLDHQDYQETVSRWTQAVTSFAREVDTNVGMDEHSTEISPAMLLEIQRDQKLPKRRTQDEPGNLLTT